MRKVLLSFFGVIVLVFGGFSYKVYDNYKSREEKINHVLEFQKVAFKAYSKLMSGENKEAVKLYEEAVKLHDKDTKTLLDYSTALAKMGENKKSIEMYEKAYLSANYKNEEVLEKLAKANFDIQNYDKSIKYYKEAIERFRPKYRYIENIIIALDKQNKTDEAMKYFAYIQEKSPRYFIGKKDFDKFSNIYTKDIKSYDLLPLYDTTQNLEALLSLGEEYEKKGLDDKALKAYDKILYQDVNHQKANEKISNLLIKYKDYEYAIVHLETLDNDSLDVLNKKANAYHQIKNYEKAIEFYEQALKLEQNENIYKNLASCAFRMADKDKTMKYLKKLKELNPRMAYNFEYITLLSMGHEIDEEDRIEYHIVNTWYDLQELLLKNKNKNEKGKDT